MCPLPECPWLCECSVLISHEGCSESSSELVSHPMFVAWFKVGPEPSRMSCSLSLLCPGLSPRHILVAVKPRRPFKLTDPRLGCLCPSLGGLGWEAAAAQEQCWTHQPVESTNHWQPLLVKHSAGRQGLVPQPQCTRRPTPSRGLGAACLEHPCRGGPVCVVIGPTCCWAGIPHLFMRASCLLAF